MRRFRKWTPKETRDEVVLMYLVGEKSVEELGEYYNVNPTTIRTWIKRYRQSKKVVSLQPDSKTCEDMARKKKEAEKSADVLALEAHIRELELHSCGRVISRILTLLVDAAICIS